MRSVDLSGHKVVSQRHIEAALEGGAVELRVGSSAVLTPSARDLVRAKGVVVRTSSGSRAPSAREPGKGSAPISAWDALYHSPQAEAAKAEIVQVGRKLWQRQYVDGNGGNISFRLADGAVLCTPTLVSKADITPEDLCLVDLDGNQLVGARPRTSEILMHLEIYKAVPEARAVVHCHPPHATAFAITGRVPTTCVIPEYEVFIGSAALSPYETPGTPEFAQTVLPYVRSHNTVLLANHGIVCWADTVTHAEWYAEVVDTYCWTLLLASQLGAPITHIPDEKAVDLLEIKKRMGLPDVRLGGDLRECQLCDLPDLPGAIALPPASSGRTCSATDSEAEAIIQAVTDAIMASFEQEK